MKTQIINLRSEIGVGYECGPCVVLHRGGNNIFECNEFRPVVNRPMPLSENSKGEALRCPGCLKSWPPIKAKGE